MIDSPSLQTARKERELRVLVLGLDNAGKTTIVKRLIGEDVRKVEPTLGFQITTLLWPREGKACCSKGEKLRNEGRSHLDAAISSTVALNLWDIGGQRSIRAFWRNYFERTEAIVWVVDSSDSRRLPECRSELAALVREDRLAGASILIFANKCDIPGALDEATIAMRLGLGPKGGMEEDHENPTTDQERVSDRAIERAMGRGNHSWKVVQCSALSGANVVEGMDWIVQDVVSRMYAFER